MRNLILDKIEKIKKEQDNFVGQRWQKFRVGHILIKDFHPEGLQDEMLLDFYTEVLNWNATQPLF